MRDVELQACQHAEVKAELVALQETMERYALKYAMPPRQGLKEKVMEAIGESKADGKLVSMPGKARQDAPETDTGISAEARTTTSLLSKLMLAASLFIAIAMSGFTYFFSHQLSSTRSQLSEVERQQKEMIRQADQLQLAMNEDEKMIQILTDANTLRITMKGTEKSPASMALVYWNKESKQVFLDIKALPPVPPDQQYQLWFIDPETGPVSAGVFDVKQNEIMQMIDAPAAAAFAVTLEPKGGSVSPTLEQLQVIGNVNS